MGAVAVAEQQRSHGVLLKRLQDTGHIAWVLAPLDSACVPNSRGETSSNTPTSHGVLGTMHHVVVDRQGALGTLRGLVDTWAGAPNVCAEGILCLEQFSPIRKIAYYFRLTYLSLPVYLVMFGARAALSAKPLPQVPGFLPLRRGWRAGDIGSRAPLCHGRRTYPLAPSPAHGGYLTWSLPYPIASHILRCLDTFALSRHFHLPRVCLRR